MDKAAAIQTLLELRSDPRYDKLIPPDAQAVLHSYLGDQDAQYNQATPWPQRLVSKIPFQGDQKYAPTETNIFGDLTRPAGAIHAFMKSQEAAPVPPELADNPDIAAGLNLPKAIQAAQTGFQQPRSEGADYTVPPDASTREVGMPELVARGAMGLATDPLSYFGPDVLKIAGEGAVQGLSHLGGAAETLSRFSHPVPQAISRAGTAIKNAMVGVAKAVPNLAPDLLGRVQGSNLDDVFHLSQVPKDLLPADNLARDAQGQPISVNMPDQNAEYQAWLEQNAMPEGGVPPEADVPLHPPEEGRAAAENIAQRVEFDPNGQGEFRFVNQDDLSGQSPDIFNLGRKGRAPKPFKGGDAGVQMEMPEGFQWDEANQGNFDFMRNVAQREVPEAQLPGGPSSEVNPYALPGQQEFKFKYGPEAKPIDPAVQEIISRRKAGGNVVKDAAQPVPEAPSAPNPAWDAFQADAQKKFAEWASQPKREVPNIIEQGAGVKPAVPAIKEVAPKPAMPVEKAVKIVQKAAKKRVEPALLKKAQQALREAVPHEPYAEPAPKAVPGRALSREELKARLMAKIKEREASGVQPVEKPLSVAEQQKLSIAGNNAVKGAKLKAKGISMGEDVRPAQLEELAKVTPKSKLNVPAVQGELDNIVGKAPSKISDKEVVAERAKILQRIMDLKEHIKEANGPAKEILKENLKGWEENLKDVRGYMERDVKPVAGKKLNAKAAWDDFNEGFIGGESGQAGLRDMSPERKAARERFMNEHVPAIREELRNAGRQSLESILKAKFPQANAAAIREMAQMVNSKAKIGNIAAYKMPEETRQQVEKLQSKYPNALKEPGKVSDSDVMLNAANQTKMDKVAEVSGLLDPEDRASYVKHLQAKLDDAAQLAKQEGVDPKIAEDRMLDATYEMLRAAKADGLALRAWREFKTSPEMAAYFKKKLLAGEYTPEQEAKIRPMIDRAEQAKPGFWKKLDGMAYEWAINSALSRAFSLGRNLIGATYNTLSYPITQGVNVGLTALLKNVPGLKLRDTATPEQFGAIMNSLRKNFVPQVKKAVERIWNEKAGMEANSHLGELGLQNTEGKIPGPVGYAVRTFGRTIKAVDALSGEYIHAMASDSEYVKQVMDTKEYKVWQDDMARAKKSGNKAEIASLKDRLTQLFAREYGKLNEEGRIKAEQDMLTFGAREQLPEILKPIALAIQKTPSKFFVMFLRAMYAIPHNAYKFSPAAIPAQVWKDARVGSISTKEWSKIVTGTSLLYAGYLKNQAEGTKYYGATQSPEERDVRTTAGLPQNGYKLHPDGSWEPLSDAAPLSYVDGVYTMLDEFGRRRARGQELGEAAAISAQQLGLQFLNTSFMASLKRPLDIIFNNPDSQYTTKVYGGKNEGEHIERNKAEQYLSGTAAGLAVPGFVSEAKTQGNLYGVPLPEDWRDNTVRRPRNIGDDFKNKIPGLSKDVPARVDALGEDVTAPRTDNPIANAFGLARHEPINDPVRQMLMDLRLYPSQPAKDNQGLIMSLEKREAINRAFGPQIKEILSGYATDPDFRALPEELQAKEITKILSELRTPAQQMQWLKAREQVQGMPWEERRAVDYHKTQGRRGVVSFADQ